MAGCWGYAHPMENYVVTPLSWQTQGCSHSSGQYSQWYYVFFFLALGLFSMAKLFFSPTWETTGRLKITFIRLESIETYYCFWLNHWDHSCKYPQQGPIYLLGSIRNKLINKSILPKLPPSLPASIIAQAMVTHPPSSTWIQSKGLCISEHSPSLYARFMTPAKS